MAISNTPAQDYVQSDYSHSARFKANGSAQEQKFIENLVVESIEIYGQDIYYVPRTIVNRDTVFGEDSDGKFESAKPIRAYVNNVEGWEGQGELLTKFGIRIEDKTTFIFSREKFKEKVDDSTTLNVEGRPNEGDLIWFPITKHLFEISERILNCCFLPLNFCQTQNSSSPPVCQNPHLSGFKTFTHTRLPEEHSQPESLERHLSKQSEILGQFLI